MGLCWLPILGNVLNYENLSKVVVTTTCFFEETSFQEPKLEWPKTQIVIFLWNVLKTFPFTKQCSLRSFKSLCEQKVSETSDFHCFQKSPKEYVKNLSEVYRKQNDQKNRLS